MYQKVTIIGRLGNEVNFKTSQSGINFAQFSVATSKKTKDGHDEIEWFYCTAFNRTAEVARDYLKKGHLVFCEGELKTTKYNDKDGVARQSVGLNVFQIKLLTPREEQKQEQKREASTANPYGDLGKNNFAAEYIPDDLPF